MELKVKKVVQGSTVILQLQGILDISTTNLIDPYLEELGNIDLLIIDFAELEFIDSTGIGSIMNAIHLSEEKKFKLKLQGVNELTNEVFEMVGLYQILNAFQGGGRLMFHDGFTYYNDEQKTMDKSLEREMNLAKNIQSSLLNGKVPTFEGGKVLGSSLPARLIGGDYYDFYPLLNGKLRIVIGDVMGKGIPAAMLMILTRGAFRSAAESTQSPADTLTAINQAIYDDLRTLKSFVTLFCADWDPKARTFTYANAGHNLPLLLKDKTAKIEPLPKVKGIMIGGLPNQVYKEESLQLDTKDMVFFYTDGIVEAQNKAGEQYKLERLTNTLLSNHHKDISEIQQEVMYSVSSFTEGVPQKDDITMVLLKIFEQKTDITSINSPLL